MKVEANLVERTSKEGKQYIAIEIVLTPGYKKLVFLTPSELELLRITKKNNN